MILPDEQYSNPTPATELGNFIGWATPYQAEADHSATEHGYQFIRTIDHKHNQTILKINQELGFKIKVNHVLIIKEVL